MKSMRSSRDSSAAGNLSPGRHHHERQSMHRGGGSGGGYREEPHHHGGGHRSRRESSGGGFFGKLFGGGGQSRRRDQSQGGNSDYPAEGSPRAAPPAPAANTSPASRLKAFLSFAPQGPARKGAHAGALESPTRGGPVGPGGLPSTPEKTGAEEAADNMTVKDLQHRLQLAQAQVQDYERIKASLAVEQRTANEWKEKWNYQNFKLNLMVDMLVLRVLELDQPGPGGR
ncbi:hypothetical protein HYH03_013743 [Edaphochlamys debaryana]|uniref:Uncharacterized protein n=1 Tax=Edaphochlamys debaryana TaxID=47281 RepID=A0A835XQ13_9CHLO|nr:hypothetical protein HYH03_013743 [Edaphochlamys debaryana]|eukprot:KAG2487604.1 hypothetical protein HYH03_013743 [Edaphochlamys debaryana]